MDVAQPPQVDMKVPAEIPYDQKTAAQIKDFYRKKSKNPAQYRIGDDGTLNIYNKDGTLQSSIQLKSYRPITTEERDFMEQYRLDKLAALDVLYEQEHRKLLKAYSDYKNGGSIKAVLLANEQVTNIELQRVATRSSIRRVKQIAIPKTNEVIFDEPYEERKLFGAHNLFGVRDTLNEGVFVLERRNFSSSLLYGRYDEPGAIVQTGEETSRSEDSVSVRLANGLTARLFYRPEEVSGFLSPLQAVRFTHRASSTEFSSAYQAYEWLRMNEQGLTEIRNKILKSTTARTVGVHTVKYKTPAKNPRALWTEILTDLYSQHPSHVEALLTTGQDSLVYANPAEGSGGIGLVPEDNKILDPANWKYENIVGKVLESLRATFREGSSPASDGAPPPEAEQKAITPEEKAAADAAAKKGAIIKATLRRR